MMTFKYSIKKLIVYISLLLFGIMVLFQPPMDPDFGWHFKYGEYMVQNRSFLRQNIFSYTYTNYKWANSYWLFDIGVYLLYSNFGTIFSGILLGAMICTALLYFLSKQTNNLVTSSVVFVITVILFMIFNVSIRPFMVSTLLMLVFLDILLHKEKWLRYFHYLPILFLFWANVHADFVIALFILGIKTANDFFMAKKFKPVFLLPITCFGITIFNPNGIQLWITLFKELSSPIKNTIAEWKFIPTDQHEFLYFFITIAVLIFATTTVQIRLKKAPIWYVICVILFFVLAVKSVYFIRIFYLLGIFAFIPTVDLCIAYLVQRFGQNKAMLQNVQIICMFLLFIIVLAAGAKFDKSISLAKTTQSWSTEFIYPFGAINFIKENNLEGNIFNTYDWGGYLIWQLPTHKTFIDGRMASWRYTEKNYFLDEYSTIVRQPKNGGWEIFERNVQKYNIKLILTRKNSDFAQYIQQQKPNNWQITYEDAISALYTHK